MKRSQAEPSPSVAPHALPEAYQQALDKHSIVSMTDKHGTITYANDMFCAISGYSRDELIGANHSLLNSGLHDKSFFADMLRTIASGQAWSGDIRNVTKSGDFYWVDTNITPLFDESGSVSGYMSIRRDITQRKLAENELKRSEAFLRNVAHVASVGGWSLDLASSTVYWSEQTKKIHEVPQDYEPDLNTAIEFYKPEARSTITHAVENALVTGESWDLELPMQTATGRDIWVRAVGHVLYESNEPISLVGAFQDITESKMAESALRMEVTHRHQAEQLLLDVLETIPGAVAAYDDDDKLIVCNSSYMTTYAAAADVIYPGANFEDIVRVGVERGQYAGVGSSPEAQKKWLTERLQAYQDPPEQMTQKLRDGTWLQIRERRSQTGTSVGVSSDITALKRAEEKLRKFAEEDPLTGLNNRASFCDALDRVLATRDISMPKQGCVALFDIDHFKPINDAYGHDVGDEVLIEVAERLKLVLEEGGVAARLGGDEFVFFLSGCSTQAACEAIVQELFTALEDPIYTSVGEVTVSLSLGLTHLDMGTGSSRILLKQADMALYRVKQEGRGSWRWFSREDWAEMNRETVMGKALTIALENDDGVAFSMLPLVDAHSARPLGFSVEMHWTYEDQNLSSVEISDLAQKANQTARLCRTKTTKALSVVGDHHARGISCGLVWMTISAEQLRLDSFFEMLESTRSRFQVPAETIMIAVEETALTQRSSSAVVANLRAVQAAGMKIAIDRFGSGETSITLLQSLGVSAVRLDEALTEQSDAMTNMPGLIKVAKALDIAVFAGSVESAERAALFATNGCNGLQGPLVGDFLYSCEVTAYLAEHAARELAGFSNRLTDDHLAGQAEDAA